MSFVCNRLLDIAVVVDGVEFGEMTKQAPHNSICRAGLFSNATRLKERQAAKIRELRSLLRAEGFCSVDSQAAALGLSRSTTWALLQADHKHSGVSVIVLKRMRATPNLPQRIRQWIEEYVQQRLAGAYGHSPNRLRIFEQQFGQGELSEELNEGLRGGAALRALPGA